MAKGYVIYNPLSGNGMAKEDAQLLQFILDEEVYENGTIHIIHTDNGIL